MASAEHHTLGGLTQATYRSPLEGWVPEVTVTTILLPELLLAHLVLGRHGSMDRGLALLIVLLVKLEYSSLA